MEKKIVKVWREGYWRKLKTGNRIWIKGKYIKKELTVPSFTTRKLEI